MKLREQVILASVKGQKRKYIDSTSGEEKNKGSEETSLMSFLVFNSFIYNLPSRCKVKLDGDNKYEGKKISRTKK